MVKTLAQVFTDNGCKFPFKARYIDPSLPEHGLVLTLFKHSSDESSRRGVHYFVYLSDDTIENDLVASPIHGIGWELVEESK